MSGMFGVWHFSFTVSDIEQSVRFYRDVLGFDLVHRQEQANEYTARLVGYPGAHLKIAQFAVPGEPRGRSTHDLELVEYIAPRGRRGSIEIRNPGAAHLAFAVEEIDTFYRRLVATGVHFFSPPNLITAGINNGGFTCYFHDPDRIVLEVLQPPLPGRARE